MKKNILVKVALIIVFAIILSTVFGLIGYLWSMNGIDAKLDIKIFENAKGDSSMSFYALDKSSGELGLVWQDSSTGIRDWCDIGEVGDNVKNAFISAEDRTFYKHSGINIKRTIAAFLNHLFKFDGRFGASTITQQVVKNISGNSDPTVKRKMAEIFRALNIENHFSKDEILEMYLNIIPLSNNIYGIGAASRLYFNKSPDELSIAEAATLAGITNSPTRYNPLNNIEKCTEKRNKVLFAMFDYGCISEEEYLSAVSEKVDVDTNWETVGINSWFVETALNDVTSDLMREYDITEGAARAMLRGTDIILTMDSRVQDILEDYFENENNFPPECDRGLQFSFAVIDNTSGDFVGLIGRAGKKDANRLFNLADAPITPASSLKPLALYTPLIENNLANPATLFNDIPIFYDDTDQGVVGYPKNSPDSYNGIITLADSVAYSKNTVAMEIYNTLGQNKVVEYITDKFKLGPLGKADLYPAPLALGQLSKGISLRQLCSSYAVFPNDGIRRTSRTYLGVFAKDGTILLDNAKEEERIMKITTARVMTSLLEAPVDYGTARGIDLKNLIDTAGKTGTSGGDKDRLFIGYTPIYTAGIWCGYPDNKKEIGSVFPSHTHIWDEVMKQIHALHREENLPSFNREDLLKLSFSRVDGKVVSGDFDSSENYLIGYFSYECLPSSFENKWIFSYDDERI